MKYLLQILLRILLSPLLILAYCVVAVVGLPVIAVMYICFGMDKPLPEPEDYKHMLYKRGMIPPVALLILLMAVVGCNQIRYQSRFNAWNDSCKVNSDKFLCIVNCSPDSIHYYTVQGSRFYDSLHKYYKLMYPNKEEKNNNCNCK